MPYPPAVLVVELALREDGFGGEPALLAEAEPSDKPTVDADESNSWIFWMVKHTVGTDELQQQE